MPSTERKISLPFVAVDRLNASFDEIFNCEVDARLSDLGFIDVSRQMIRPRAGAEKLSVMPAGNGVIRDFFWFVDDAGNKAGYISRGGEIYKATYRTPGMFLGKFESEAAASVLSVGADNSYYIVNTSLYIFTLGVAVKQINLWTAEYDNEVDLRNDYPNPEVNLFAFLTDSQSVYYSTAGDWFPLDENYALTAITLGNNVDYPATMNSLSLPKNFQIADTARDAPSVEQVKVSTGLEGTAATYVGSFLLITSGPYQGKFGYIFNYDTSTKCFVIVSLGNATPIIAGTTYEIFEKKGKYIQITNGKDQDKYYDGSNLVTNFQGFVKQHLEKFMTFPSGGPGVMFSYGSQVFTTVNDTFFQSDVGQPLFFNINDSIDLGKSSAISNIYVWQNKIVVSGTNFATIINPDISSGGERTTDIGGTYGIVPGTTTQVRGDFWFLTTTGEILPQSQTIYGTILEKDNVGSVVRKYLKTIKYRATSCFDGRKFYIYGEDKNEAGYTCVYDIVYRFWSVYTGIRPAKFISENGKLYFVEFGTGNLYQLLHNKVSDSGTKLDQYLASKDQDLGNIFLLKKLDDISVHVENIDQKVDIVAYPKTHDHAAALRQTYTFVKRDVINANTLGFNNVPIEPPKLHRFPFGDRANAWRFQITSTGNNGFFLNQIVATFKVSEPDFITFEK